MGQYYYVVNIDKKQYLHPHRLGQGLKLMEFGCSGYGVMTALAVLCSSGNGRGGGDFRGDHHLVGSWAGDRIVIAGDYADEGDHVNREDATRAWYKLVEEGECTQDEDTGEWDYTPENLNLHTVAYHAYEDISAAAREMLSEDEWIAENLPKPW